MSDNFDKVRALRNPRYQSVQEAPYAPPPPVQYVAERRESSLPIVSLVLCILLTGFIVFQQFQIAQLSEKVDLNQSSITSLQNDLTLTNQKAEAALTAIKETQSRERVCRAVRLFPVVGDWLCAVSDLRRNQ